MGDAYDVAVIGAGTGGYSAAFRAAQLGQRVAIDRPRRTTRRHVPAARLHPHEGPAAVGRGDGHGQRRRRPGGSRPPASPTGRRSRVRAQHRRQAREGRHRPREAPRHRCRCTGSRGWSPGADRGRRPRRGGPARRDRVGLRAEAAPRRDAVGPRDHERRRAVGRRGAGLGRRDRRRRGGPGVRFDLPVVRRRRHPDRGAPPAGAARGRGPLEGDRAGATASAASSPPRARRSPTSRRPATAWRSRTRRTARPST